MQDGTNFTKDYCNYSAADQGFRDRLIGGTNACGDFA